MEQCEVREELASGSVPVDRLQELLRSVLAITGCPAELGSAVPHRESSEQVLFDLDVDGNRYILIRTEPIDRNGFSLSPREREIVRMVALGHQNKVIAAVLNISAWTVCTHVRRIFAKLGVSSRAAMVARVTEFHNFGEPNGQAEWGAPSRGGVGDAGAPSRSAVGDAGAPSRSGGVADARAPSHSGAVGDARAPLRSGGVADARAPSRSGVADAGRASMPPAFGLNGTPRAEKAFLSDQCLSNGLSNRGLSNRGLSSRGLSTRAAAREK
jgi:DNA-binding CsgD family transcriptional regulator